MCPVLEWLLSLAGLFSYLPWMNFIGESLCAQYLWYSLRYFDDIWFACISGQVSVSCASIVAFLCLPFELSPLNELYRGKACALDNTHTFWDILMIHMHQWLLPLLPFWDISLEWTLERKACAFKNSYTLWDILMIFGIHICQFKTMCKEWLLPLATLLSYLPCMNFIGESLWAHILGNPLYEMGHAWVTEDDELTNCHHSIFA